MRRAIVGMTVAMLLAGCSMGQDVSTTEKAIGAFHAQINAGQFDAVYAASADEMKKATSQVVFDRMMAAIHHKLGAFKSGKSLGWNDNLTTNGHMLTLNYAAVYDSGAADENFIYRVNGDRAALVGYHVNSQALLLN
jgi:hypothetical protein